MTSEVERFSRWQPLAEAGAAPDAPGVVQVKIADGLLVYPRGRRAMLWDSASPSISGDIDRARAWLADRVREADLRVRFLATPTPDRTLARLTARFLARFGAAPGATSPGDGRHLPVASDASPPQTADRLSPGQGPGEPPS